MRKGRGYCKSRPASRPAAIGEISYTNSRRLRTDDGAGLLQNYVMEKRSHQGSSSFGVGAGDSKGLGRFKRIARGFSLLPVLMLLLANQAQADSFRCGLKVVRSGDSQSALIKACGEPKRRDSAQERVGSASGQKTVRVQRWYYRNSGRRLERVVMLHEGKVVAVRIADH